VAVTGLSHYYHEVSCRYLEKFYTGNGKMMLHLYNYYSTEGKLPQPIKLNGQKKSTLADLLNSDQLVVFFHDIEDHSSINGFTSLIRGIVERAPHPSTIIMSMRPATAFRVYVSGRSPLFGRATRLEEPLVHELGIDDQYAEIGGYLDLYRGLVINDVKLCEDIDSMTLSNSSEMFNLLHRFWNYLCLVD